MFWDRQSGVPRKLFNSPSSLSSILAEATPDLCLFNPHKSNSPLPPPSALTHPAVADWKKIDIFLILRRGWSGEGVRFPDFQPKTIRSWFFFSSQNENNKLFIELSRRSECFPPRQLPKRRGTAAAALFRMHVASPGQPQFDTYLAGAAVNGSRSESRQRLILDCQRAVVF